jgi:hypothetical protein
MNTNLGDLLCAEITENTTVSKIVEIEPILLGDSDLSRTNIVIEKSKELLKTLQENDIVILK